MAAGQEGPGPWFGGGFLLVDKPSGPTSHDVVAMARRGLGLKKIGHTGTLDPFASGLLILCVGRATRLAEFVVKQDKTYVATLRFGEGTDSLDRDGQITEQDDTWRSLDPSEIRAATSSLLGPIEQIPPSLSAIKVDGVPAHRRVRRGEDVTLKPRPVTIHEFEVRSIELPHADLMLRCSSGTYVRTLAKDFAALLGTSAHLRELRRTAIGSALVDHAVGVDALGSGEIPQEAWLHPADALATMPSVQLDEDRVQALAQGKPVEVEAPDGGPVTVFGQGTLVAIGNVAAGRLKPSKVFHSA